MSCPPRRAEAGRAGTRVRAMAAAAKALRPSQWRRFIIVRMRFEVGWLECTFSFVRSPQETWIGSGKTARRRNSTSFSCSPTGRQLEDCCDLDNASGVGRVGPGGGERGAGVGGGMRGGGTLRTSKEHPRNMLATCLLLLRCSGDATVLLRPWPYFSFAFPFLTWTMEPGFIADRHGLYGEIHDCMVAGRRHRRGCP